MTVAEQQEIVERLASENAELRGQLSRTKAVLADRIKYCEAVEADNRKLQSKIYSVFRGTAAHGRRYCIDVDAELFWRMDEKEKEAAVTHQVIDAVHALMEKSSGVQLINARLREIREKAIK